jgi:tetratricopeptide (TPR) repeat protein
MGALMFVTHISMHRPLFYALVCVLLALPAMKPCPANAQNEDAQPPTQPASAQPASSQMYEYREKGLRALGDKAYASAARFFTAYRDATAFKEPEFSDATTLLIQAHLGRGALEEATAANALHTQKSRGLDEPFYAQNLVCWQNALAIRQGDAEAAAKNLEKLLESTRFPEIQTLAQYLLGEAYIQLARWDQAEGAFNSVVEAGSSAERATQAKLALVRVHVAREDYDAARKLLEAIRTDGDVPPEMVRLQSILIDMAAGDMDRAMESFNTVAAATPNTNRENWWTVLSHLVSKLVALERWDDAVQVIPVAEGVAPTFAERIELGFQLAEIYRLMNNPAKATATLEALKQEVRSTKDEVNVALKLAQIARQQKRFEEAAKHFEVVVNSKETDQTVRYRAAMSQGWCLNELKNFNEAGNAFAKASELAPTPAQKATALLFSADSAAQTGLYDLAVERYQTVADKLGGTPVAATARLRQAQTLAQQGQYKEAALVYRKFLEDFPKDDRNAEAMFQLGVALAKSGDNKDAIETLNAFVEKHPTHENAPQALLEAYRAARTSSLLETAMRLLTKVCSDYPDSDLYATALYHRIHTAFLLGDSDLALTDAEQFVRDFPNLPMSADVLLWLGDHFSALADYGKAADYYLRIALIHPDLPQAQAGFFQAASCALKSGNTERAETLIDQLLETPEDKQEKQPQAQAAFLRGNILAEKSAFEEAKKAYELAAKNAAGTPMEIIAKGRVADMLFTLGTTENLEQAAKTYRQLLEQDGLTPKLKENLKFRLARTLEETGDSEAALDLYLEVVFEYDIDVRAGRIRDWYYFTRSADQAARILTQKGQMDAAARVYERIEKSGVPYAEEAGRRAREIREAHDIDN